MSTEIDLVREFMNATDVSADELPLARSILDGAISADGGLDQGGETMAGGRPRDHTRRPRRLARWSVAALVAAAAIAAVLILQVGPSSKVAAPVAAAAEISRLAETVQPTPALLPGQWYQYQLQGSLSAHVSLANRPTTNATASIPISIGEWSSSTDAICTSQQFGTATFASPADSQAWQAMGLIDTPANQPATGCSAGVEASVGGGGSSEPINVSNITHDPQTLVTQLQEGTTDIPTIDQYGKEEPANVAGFVRLTVLLVGPTSGQWSGFGQEMLKTMALLPGVGSLGKMASHSGTPGLGFSMTTDVGLNPTNGAETSSFSPPTVILDPQSGALLEARNLNIPVLQSAAQDFVGSPSAPVYTDGVGYGITAQWIDPVGTVSVIAQAALPSWVSSFHIIEAVTNSSATDAQVSDVVNPFLGKGNSAFSDGNTPSPAQTTYDITVMGTTANEQAVASALTDSGLFASVSVKL